MIEKDDGPSRRVVRYKFKIVPLSVSKRYTYLLHDAHVNFKAGNDSKLAESLADACDMAVEMYESKQTEEWDMRAYLDGNAAGGVFEKIGDLENASKYYSRAFISLERLVVNRPPEWQKNVDHLRFLIERVNSRKSIQA